MYGSFEGRQIMVTWFIPSAAWPPVGSRNRPSFCRLPSLLLDPPRGGAVMLALVPWWNWKARACLQ